MATVAYNSSQINAAVGLFTGGLGGAPKNVSIYDRGKLAIVNFDFTQGSTIGNVGDTILIGSFEPTAKLYAFYLQWSTGTSSETLSIGTYDHNNNTGYVGCIYAATAATTAGNSGVLVPVGTSSEATYVAGGGMPLGLFPAGDESTGNSYPNYGSALVDVLITDAGAGIKVGQTISGWLLVVTQSMK